MDAAAARRATWILRIAGTVMLIFAGVAVATFPRTPARRNLPGFRSPIMGFELARTPEQVADILGDPGTTQRADYAARMDRGNRGDFVFLLAYATFHAGIALRLAALGHLPRVPLVVLLVLAVDMALFDGLENRELLFLSTAAPSPEMTASLARLHIFTLVKWYAIFASAALLVPFLRRESPRPRWNTILFALAALWGLLGLVDPADIERGAFTIVLAWLATYVNAVRGV